MCYLLQLISDIFFPGPHRLSAGTSPGGVLIVLIIAFLIVAVKLEKESLYLVFGYEVVTVLGNVIAGVILGGISLGINPQHIIPNIQIRFVNLVITPLVVGALVNLSSNIKFNKKLLGFDLVNFIAGYTFALAWAGVRFIFAK